MSQTYAGGCHCGAVRYEATTDLSSTLTCNCSICSKTGAVMAFGSAGAFSLLRGEDVLTDYQFHKRHIHHTFCSRCGVRSFAHGAGEDGTITYMLNVRCLDGVDVDSLEPDRYDGASL